MPACRSCNSSRGWGTLWLKFPPGARRDHAREWCHRKRFKCGHLITEANAYRPPSRVWLCLECHRARALAYWNTKRAGYKAPAL